MRALVQSEFGSLHSWHSKPMLVRKEDVFAFLIFVNVVVSGHDLDGNLLGDRVIVEKVKKCIPLPMILISQKKNEGVSSVNRKRTT